MTDRDLVVARTDELDDTLLAQVRALLDAAFEDPAEPDEAFTDDDWQHALGGTHVVQLDAAGRVVAHAAVVDRILDVGGRPLRTGYVEGVATRADLRHRGHGSRCLARIGDVLRERHQLGALATGAFTFYEHLGWERWRGPSFVRIGDGLQRTAEDDDAIMVLRVDPTLVPDLAAPISCDHRPGDVW